MGVKLFENYKTFRFLSEAPPCLRSKHQNSCYIFQVQFDPTIVQGYSRYLQLHTEKYHYLFLHKFKHIKYHKALIRIKGVDIPV